MILKNNICQTRKYNLIFLFGFALCGIYPLKAQMIEGGIGLNTSFGVLVLPKNSDLHTALIMGPTVELKFLGHFNENKSNSRLEYFLDVAYFRNGIGISRKTFDFTNDAISGKTKSQLNFDSGAFSLGLQCNPFRNRYKENWISIGVGVAYSNSSSISGKSNYVFGVKSNYSFQESFGPFPFEKFYPFVSAYYCNYSRKNSIKRNGFRIGFQTALTQFNLEYALNFELDDEVYIEKINLSMVMVNLNVSYIHVFRDNYNK